ncbi:hypothetical protein MBAV_001491 [Candidatus Magnetobacterium bavaricum]|uniref:Uncharacterized protein n=1 Tax=Candidatus Magnetobacterium bavaricum TaxID=29290 RepID=A0A0F3GWT3_9BACT|nr:hypothetical protein MBAV_001491 [Candidatus Magnetobacterium bavaricum]
MNKETLIDRAYELFSMFEKPLKCTIHDDCPECDDHEETLRNLERGDLSGEDIGTVGYSPLPNMTTEALLYFLPRIIELSLDNENDADEGPVLIRLIGLLADAPSSDRFKLLPDEQSEYISDVLMYIKSNCNDIIEYEGWGDDLNNAINNWKR